MTVVGTHVLQPGPQRISGSPGSWQTVLQLPAADLIGSGFRQAQFLAWCSIGNVVVRRIFSGNPRHLANIEVGLRRVGAPQPFPETVMRLDASGGSMNAGSSPPQRHTPAFWVYGRTTTQRGTWDCDLDGIEIVARSDLGGDPPGSLDVDFDVSGSAILQIDLDSLNAADWFLSRYRPLQPQENNGDGSIRRFHTTSFTGVFDGSSDFLIAHSLRFDNRHEPAIGTSCGFTLEHETAPSVLDTVHGYTFRMGWQPRGGWNGQRQQHVGGMQVLDAPADGTNLTLRGRELGLPGGTTTQLVALVHEHEIFGIDTSKLGLFRFVRKVNGAAGDIYREFGDPGFEAFEPQGYAKPLTAFVYLGMRPDDPPPLPLTSYSLRIATNGGFDLWSQAFDVLQDPLEGVHQHLGAEVGGVGGSSVQLRAYGMSNPGDAVPGRPVGADDFLFASWIWENDPDFTTLTVPAVPPETAVTLPTEGLSAASVPDAPIAPDGSWRYTPETDGTQFDADDGSRTQWPEWLGVRGTFEFTWSNLTEAQRDTLVAVIAATWRFENERTGELHVLVPDGGITWDNLPNRLVRVSGRFVELIWTT